MAAIALSNPVYRIKRRLSVLLILFLCNAAGPAFAATTFRVDTAAPAGFADLLEPQQLVADLYYGGRPIGAAAVTVDPDHVRFEDPAAVLTLLPDTLDPATVLRLLKRPQPRNAHRLCRNRSQRDCGYLLPEDFALIYDADRYRIDLFFAPELLPRQAAIDDPYLPESSSDFSLVQNLTGSWSGVDNSNGFSDQSASLYGHTIASFGESGLHSQWYAGDSGERIYQFHWSRDFHGRAYSAGLLQPGGSLSYFSPTPYLYGVEYRSSIKSRTDERYRQGAPLEVNMPVRGRVEVRRDGRLLHSELLEAGNQLLDTSSLPGGAYDVEIRTFDDSGRPLAQYSRFFAKDARLPAPGEWQWSLQAGKPALADGDSLLPRRADEHLFQAGIARRLSDNTGLFASTAATGSQQVAELGGRWVGHYLELSPSLLQSSHGRSGYRWRALLKTDWFNLSASHAKLDPVREPARSGDFSLLHRGYSRTSAALNANLLGGQLSLRYSESDRERLFASPEFELDTDTAGADRLRTLNFRRTLWRGRRWQGDLTLSHSDADGRQLTSASLQFRLRGEHWNHSANLRSDNRSDESQTQRASFQSNWRDRTRWAGDFKQRFEGEIGDDDYFLQSQTSLAGRRGHLSSTLRYLDRDAGSSVTYLGNFSTSLISGGDGDFAWGGERALKSALLVDIDGSPEQDFEILVDNSRRGYVKGGGRSVINLPAFGSYNVSLRPLADGFFDYRDKPETITLYPGNVADIRYDVNPLILVMGRMVRGDEPVPRTKISIGEHSAVTDAFGVFQMEMVANPSTLHSPDVVWKDCRIPLPEQDAGKDWLNLGVIDFDKAVCGGETSVAKH